MCCLSLTKTITPAHSSMGKESIQDIRTSRNSPEQHVSSPAQSVFPISPSVQPALYKGWLPVRDPLDRSTDSSSPVCFYHAQKASLSVHLVLWVIARPSVSGGLPYSIRPDMSLCTIGSPADILLRKRQTLASSIVFLAFSPLDLL